MLVWEALMGDRRSSAAGARSALAISFVCTAFACAEGSQVIATVERPALVTAAATSPGSESRPGEQRVVVSVLGYKQIGRASCRERVYVSGAADDGVTQ